MSPIGTARSAGCKMGSVPEVLRAADHSNRAARNASLTSLLTRPRSDTAVARTAARRR